MDFVGLAAWGVIAGVLVGLALHSILEARVRSKMKRWLLFVGGAAFVIGQAAVATGSKSIVANVLVGIAFLGIPVLVAGIVMLVLGVFAKSPRKGNDEQPGV